MKTDMVVAGFVFHDGKVLLVNHAKLGMWLPPGGHIEKDETSDQALLRELSEETGLKVEILNRNDIPMKGNIRKNLSVPFYVNVHSVGDHDHCCLNYVCRALNPDNVKINKELKDSAWFTKKDLDQDRIPSDVRQIALKAFELFEKLEQP